MVYLSLRADARHFCRAQQSKWIKCLRHFEKRRSFAIHDNPQESLRHAKGYVVITFAKGTRSTRSRSDEVIPDSRLNYIGTNVSCEAQSHGE